MGSSQRTFFDLCRRERLQAYLETAIPLQDQNKVRQMRLLVTYLDQTCLDLATQGTVRLTGEGSRGARALIHPVPALPTWIELEEPLPLPGSGRGVAAFFFRAPYSEVVFQRAFVPPVVECAPAAGVRPPMWYEWHLDLIGPQAHAYREYAYRYDQRAGTWRLAADHACPWRACHSACEPGDDLGRGMCRQCRADMDYCTHLLAAALRALQCGA